MGIKKYKHTSYNFLWYGQGGYKIDGDHSKCPLHPSCILLGMVSFQGGYKDLYVSFTLEKYNDHITLILQV